MSTAAPVRVHEGPRARGRARAGRARALGGYADADGRPREIVVRPGRAGSVLVIDRDARGGREERLVAHLGADEPAENAALICDGYLRGGRGPAARCRALTIEDSRALPFREDDCEEQAGLGEVVADRRGHGYCLFAVGCRLSIGELRWHRLPGGDAREVGDVRAVGETVTLRDAIGQIEDYEPLCGATRRAIACHRDDRALSTTVLESELARVQRSPIVLNRRLRETVLEVVAAGRASMSEIALRCGRAKRDRNGNLSGETSWLARRLGLAPEGGHTRPTPWIHTEVLALIAREGLGIAPREVELG